VKYVRVPTQACLFNYHLFTFNTRLTVRGCAELTDTFHTVMWQKVSVGCVHPFFVYYMYVSVLFTQYCITVLATFRFYIHIVRKYQTISITGPPTPPVNPFIRGSTLYNPQYNHTVSHPTIKYTIPRHNYTVSHPTMKYIIC
jgi:hypothetical protein